MWAGLLVLLAMSPFVAFFALLPEDENPASSESPDAAALTEAVDLAFPFPTESPSPSPEPEPSVVPTRAAPPPPPRPAPAPAPPPAPAPEPEPSEEPSPEPTEVQPPPPPPGPPPPKCDEFTGIGCEDEGPAEEDIEDKIEEDVPAPEGEGDGEQGPTDKGPSGQ